MPEKKRPIAIYFIQVGKDAYLFAAEEPTPDQVEVMRKQNTRTALAKSIIAGSYQRVREHKEPKDVAIIPLGSYDPVVFAPEAKELEALLK